MTTDVYIQANMSSSRIPGKVLKKILNKSILELIVERVRKIKNFDRIILVTGSKEKNELLLKEAQKLKIYYFFGSEENILDRFYKASKKFNTDIIIRCTADNPLIDFNIINTGLEIFRKNNFDILGVDRKRTFPLGLNFQIFRKEALETAWNDNHDIHKGNFDKIFIPPTKYMLEKRKFKNYTLISKKDYSDIRLTLDYPEDLEMISKIYQKLYLQNKKFGLPEILDLLKKNPKILQINAKHSKKIPPIRIKD